MELTEKQTADYRRLKAYFPYRLFFLVNDPRDVDAGQKVWAVRDKRAINRVLKEGGTVVQLS